MARLYRDGKLGVAQANVTHLLPVSVVEDQEVPEAEPEAYFTRHGSALHIALLGGIRISLEGDVDPAVIRVVLKSLRS